MTDTIDLTAPARIRPADGEPLDRAGPPSEAKKAKLIRKAASLCEASLDPTERDLALAAIAKLYEHVPPGDVAGRSLRDLGGAALSLLRFVARRRPGQAKIRVYNPEPDVDGWASPHTIVEIANDDMPFLVDSVTAAINAGDRVVQLVIHPILNVDRDAGGRLRQLHDGGEAGIRESWMQIEVTREPDPAGLARLTEDLSRVLADVRAAVTD
jgi:glutamate dehydrogenase